MSEKSNYPLWAGAVLAVCAVVALFVVGSQGGVDPAGQAIGRGGPASIQVQAVKGEGEPPLPDGTPEEQFYAVTGFYPDEWIDFQECGQESENASEFSECIGTATASDDEDEGMTPQEIVDFLACFWNCTVNGGSGNRKPPKTNPCQDDPGSLECCRHTVKAICDCACDCQTEHEWDDCFDGWLFWDGCTQKLDPYCEAWVEHQAK
jgi:hypothetical protein